MRGADKTVVDGVSMRLGKVRGRPVPLTSHSTRLSFALTALDCSFWDEFPLVCWCWLIGWVGSRSIGSVCSSTRGAPDISETCSCGSADGSGEGLQGMLAA